MTNLGIRPDLSDDGPSKAERKRGVSILVYNKLVNYIKSWQGVEQHIITVKIYKYDHKIDYLDPLTQRNVVEVDLNIPND